MGSDPQALGVLAGLLGQGRAEERQVRCGRRARKPRTLVSSLACRLVCFFLFFFFPFSLSLFSWNLGPLVEKSPEQPG